MFQSIINYFNTHQQVVRRVQYILIGLFIFLIVFDIYLAVTGSETISEVIKEQTENGFFVLTYFWGAIAANFFLARRKGEFVNGIIGSLVVIGIALLIEIFNVDRMVGTYFSSHDYQVSHYSLSMALGLLVGFIFWRQPLRLI